MKAVSIAAALVLLAGCSTLCTQAPAPDAKLVQDAPKVEAVKQVCIPFRPWNDADLKILAGTLAAIPPASPVMRMALDWRRYYGDAKACNDAQKSSR